MCGIAGIVSREPIEDRALLVRMRDTMVLRGPDDAGEWWSPDGTVGLAHRRLSIIDLTPGGRQPMQGAGGRHRVVFNGEIYNYIELREELRSRGRRFVTESDTEVLLAAYAEWGTGCLDHLEGMFSLALWDSERRRLFCARDRAGEKPFFYRISGGRFTFGSVPRAILADPSVRRAVDPVELNHYLTYGCSSPGGSLLDGIKRIPPGHAALWDPASDSLSVWRYWRLPEPADPARIDPAGLEEEFERLLFDTVKKRMIADVPVGILLSGGLDSSLVTAMAVRNRGSSVKTFTASVPGHPAFDESGRARLVAEHFGTNHFEMPLRPTSFDVLPELVREYDNPIADSSIIPTYLLSREIRRHVKVALGGDGGDELTGGYRHYSTLIRMESLGRMTPLPLRSSIGHVALNLLPPGFRGRNYLIGFGGRSGVIPYINMYFDAATRRRLLEPLGELPFAGPAPETSKASIINPGRSALQNATRADFEITLGNVYLPKIDRSSMMASLELRAPLLDRRLIEFCFSKLPDSLRATATSRRVLEKRLAKRLLPEGFDLARKQGFSIPLHYWFRAGFGSYAKDLLLGRKDSFFSRRAISDLWGRQWVGGSLPERLFALLLIELWRIEYRVQGP